MGLSTLPCSPVDSGCSISFFSTDRNGARSWRCSSAPACFATAGFNSPRILWAWGYYGSPVPHTIIAKGSVSPGQKHPGFSGDVRVAARQTLDRPDHGRRHPDADLLPGGHLVAGHTLHRPGHGSCRHVRLVLAAAQTSGAGGVTGLSWRARLPDLFSLFPLSVVFSRHGYSRGHDLGWSVEVALFFIERVASTMVARRRAGPGVGWILLLQST